MGTSRLPLRKCATMARLAFAFVLFALVAVALAQNTQIVDDFVAIVPTQAATLRISIFNTETVSDSNCDPSAGGSQGQILGGCHVLSLTGNAASGRAHWRHRRRR